MPIFTIKWSFFSIFQDLQDLHTFAPLGTQFFGEHFPNFPEIYLKFLKFCKILNFANFQILRKTIQNREIFDETLRFERRRIVKIW
jgi:hypothetical protein